MSVFFLSSHEGYCLFKNIQDFRGKQLLFKAFPQTPNIIVNIIPLRPKEDESV